MVLGTISVLVISILFAFFASLISRFKKLWDSQLRILVSKLRVIDPWIFYKSFLKRRFGIFSGLFIIDNTLVYFFKHWEEQETGLSLGFDDSLY